MSENFENKAARGSISQIILKALSSRDKYGYEIIKDVENITNGKLILKQPSLYSCLRRMEEQDLITSYWQDSDIGGKRHYYSLTEKGKEHYEENQQNWSSDEALINSLPSKEVDEENINFKIDTKSPPLTNSTTILNQENLFNLNRNTQETEKNDTDGHQVEDEENKSFFQFDFFEQNVNLIKEKSNKPKQDVPAFLNNFSDTDNKESEIEPGKKQQLTAYIKNEKNNHEINKLEETINNQNTVDYESKKTPTPILKTNKLINRSDVYSIKDNLSNYIDPNLVNNDLIITETTLLNITNSSSAQNSNINQNTREPIESTNADTSNILEEEDENNKMHGESISWDFESEYSSDNALFEEDDYKSVIGRLYSNSRLEDPYEKNKFHNFKEIFPHSQINNDEELNQKKEAEESNKKERITQIIKSSEESNIDCEDIKKLNTLYNLQGIQIKVHSAQENKKQLKKYTDKNKINMVNSWIVSTIMIIELLFSYFFLSARNLYSPNSSIIYFLGLAITLSYCIISTFENLFDRFKLVIITKSFKKSFLQRIFLFILLVVAIFAINLAFGMKNLLEIKYLAFWIIPTLLALNLPASSVVFYLLLKSKNFNS